MELATIDWVLIGVYFSFSTAIALYFSKSSGKSLGEFFLGGRKLPWYVAGISMVATTFAADTPLAVTELVAQKGISGNWLWWNMLIGGMLTTFFFAKLWRRANVLTEVEFITLRYAGKPAAALRGFKAVYLGFVMNVLVMGWVNLALMSLLQQFFHLSTADAFWYTALSMVLVAAYSSIGGFMSVAFTDMFQFLIAMTGSIVLAVLVLNSEQIGGIDGLKAKLGEDSSVWQIIPQLSVSGPVEGVKLFGITFSSFFAYIGLQWWASWYPGSEPGGGGYIAQRMMSARSERDSVIATLFFQIAHYCLRPWPWIIVALCTIVLYPDLAAGQEKLGYVNAMRDFLPDGFRGLMLVAFLAAYMSTISTQLNWGASYLVNDLVFPSRSQDQDEVNPKNQRQMVLVSRIMTVALMAVALIVTSQIESISKVWEFTLECGAGLGMVLILRWFWWRINVWSEIAATIAPFFFYALSKFVLPESMGMSSFPNSYFLTIGGTTITWLVVTFLTAPEPSDTLARFHRRVKPGGFWGPIAILTGIKVKSQTGPLIVAWLSAVIMTYSALFATGKLIFKEFAAAAMFFTTTIVFGSLMYYVIKRYNLFASGEKDKEGN